MFILYISFEKGYYFVIWPGVLLSISNNITV